MGRKPKINDQNEQLMFNFDKVIESAEILSRDDVSRKFGQDGSEAGYNPISQTVDYMKRAVQFEEEWETTIQKARKELLSKDPRQLYLEFIDDLISQIRQNNPQVARLANLLELVAIRGLGIRQQYLSLGIPQRGGSGWRIPNYDILAIERHINQHILGKAFLNPITMQNNIWGDKDPIIGASDVSQHRSAVPVPARFFKRSVPFVLNNAAGALFRIENGQAHYENVFNPRPDEALLRWMLIDPSYQDELEPEDYQRCLASAMDVGQYRFDIDYLLKADKNTPNIIFRDGSIFPQDAYLDNFVTENKRGEFTREAIRELLNCLSYAREIGVTYCGVTKVVQLKVYSAILDWYISRNIDKNWEIGNYTLNDGQAMSLLLSSPDYVGDKLNSSIMTCLIKRSFTTRANLNTRANLDDLQSYFARYENQHNVDITPFKRLCDLGHFFMFFIGHSKSPQSQLPRYEFFSPDKIFTAENAVHQILSSLQLCGFTNDNDHSFMADKPITYLIPAVTQQAHYLSKDVGKYIDSHTGQWIMARYRSMLPVIKG